MNSLLGIFIALLLSFIVTGIAIIKNDGYFIARNPFFGPEETNQEQQAGFKLAYSLIGFSTISLFILLLFNVHNIFLKVVCLTFFTVFILWHYFKNIKEE